MKSFKKAIVLVVALALVLTAIPAQIFAADTTSSTSTVKVKAVTKNAGVYSVKASQVKVNSRYVSVSFPKIKSIKALKGSKKVTYVKAYLSMYLDGKPVTSISKQVKLSKVSNTSKNIKLYAPAYGKYKLTVMYKNAAKKTIKKVVAYRVGVVAREYNVAMLTATYGPTIFGLQCFDQKYGESTTKSLAANIPTYVCAARPASLNWKAMPKNVHRNPLEMYPSKVQTNLKIAATKQFVKDLHQMNPNSKIHLYLTDTYINGILEICYANGLKDSQFDVTLLSDGNGTYWQFQSVYNDANADKVYNKMAGEWALAKKTYASGKTLKYTDFQYPTTYAADRLKLARYACVAVNENSNVKWIIGNKGVEVFGGQYRTTDGGKVNTSTYDFVTEKILNNANVVGVSIANILKGVQDAGNAAAFKKYYCLNEKDMFSAAIKNKRLPMVIMGSRVSSEKNFEQFASFVKKYYGNTYEYYYKGHPSTPTDSWASKRAQLSRLGMHDVQSTIPAELILFFCPNIYCCGVSNSTLNSSYVDGHCKAMYGYREANKTAITAGEKFDIFFTPASQLADNEADNAIKALMPDNSHDCFLAEFVAQADKDKHEIAIWDYTAKSIKYYKNNGGTYSEVAK